MHVRTAAPSTCIVQAPQRPAPHPNLDPFNPNWSRTIYKRGVLGSSSVRTVSPFSVNSIKALLLPFAVENGTCALSFFLNKSLRFKKSLSLSVSSLLLLLPLFSLLILLLLLRLLLSLLLFSSTYHPSLWSYPTQPFSRGVRRTLDDWSIPCTNLFEALPVGPRS